jgi:hypothetical protein
VLTDFISAVINCQKELEGYDIESKKSQEDDDWKDGSSKFNEIVSLLGMFFLLQYLSVMDHPKE